LAEKHLLQQVLPVFWVSSQFRTYCIWRCGRVSDATERVADEANGMGGSPYLLVITRSFDEC
jgi:hypothetical protein